MFLPGLLLHPKKLGSRCCLKVATLLLTRGGNDSFGPACGDAVAALADGLEPTDRASYAVVWARVALSAFGRRQEAALDITAALARTQYTPGCLELASAVLARIAFFEGSGLCLDNTFTPKNSVEATATATVIASEGTRKHAAELLFATLVDAARGTSLDDAADGGGAALAPLITLSNILAIICRVGRKLIVDADAASMAAVASAWDALSRSTAFTISRGVVVLRTLSCIAICLLLHTKPSSESYARAATATAILEDANAGLRLIFEAREPPSVADTLVARASVSLLHCARGHPVSRLARDLVNKAWALSTANGPVSDAAFSSILIAVVGESMESTNEGTNEEDDVSEAEVLCVTQRQSTFEEDEDILLKENELAAYLEQEAAHHDKENELLSVRNAGRKAGQTANYVADLALRLRALDLLEQCFGPGQIPPRNSRCLNALGPLTRLAMVLDEGPDCHEATDLAVRLSGLVSGKIGRHISMRGLAHADVAAAADLLGDLLNSLCFAPHGRGHFETVATLAVAVLTKALDVQGLGGDAVATAQDAYAAALSNALSSKKSKLKTKVLRDAVRLAPGLASVAFLSRLPALAMNAPSSFLAHEAIRILHDLYASGRIVTNDVAANEAGSALAILVADSTFAKTGRLKTLLEAANALVAAHPDANTISLKENVKKIAFNHASSTVRCLAAKLGVLDHAKKNKRQRDNAVAPEAKRQK